MNAPARKTDLTDGVVWVKMLKYAAPIFSGTLFQSFYTTADAMIVGRYGGKAALAAIESVFTLTRLPANLFMGIATGATILLSQSYGAKKYREVSDASHTAILFAVLGGIVLAILGCVMAPVSIRWVQVPAAIAGDARRYLLVYYAGIAASLVFNVASGILRALGNSRQPFLYLVAANFLNVGLDLLFVAALRLGVVGAAIATVLSQLVCAVLLLMELTRTELPCRIALNRLRFHRSQIASIFRLGLPIGIQSALYPISNTVVQTGINVFGVNSIAARGISGKLDFLIWTISDAFGIAVSTFVAQNVGAEKFGRARSATRAGLGMACLLILTISAVLYLWGEPLATFLVDDLDVIELTGRILRFISPLYVAYVFCDVLAGAIRGQGDTVLPMMVSLLGICLFRVLWIFFVAPIRPTLMTALACYPISWVVTGLMFIGLFLYKEKATERAEKKIA